MHSHRCLSGAGHSLNDHVCLGGFSDDLILFLLYGGDDLSQDCFLILCQIFVQKLVCGYDIRIIKIFQPVIFNLISPFPPQINMISPLVFYRIAAGPQGVFIINRRHRSSPVNDQRLCISLGDPHSPHIVRFLPGGLGIFKIDPAEIRFLSCPLTPEKFSLVFF